MLKHIEALVNQGQLKNAVVELQKLIKQQPADAKLRVFLFQLLCLLGQWERALTQLNVIEQLDSSAALMVKTYQDAIKCEALRADVFSGKYTPLVFGEPTQWLALLFEALRLDAEAKYAEALALRKQGLALSPAISGSINQEPFAWLADADNRLGPVLEAVIKGRYYWIPLQYIKKIEIESPSDLRDFVWLPASITWTNEGTSASLIPSRYPGSENSEDGLLQLARKTDWQEISEGIYQGIGQRLLATDLQDYALLDIRNIEFTVQSD